MSLLSKIQESIKTKHLLLHPFYQDWMQGKLTRTQLQHYAEQYTPFVDAFPRFVSATHSLCENSKARKLLLENLNDEEGEKYSPPHPELWRDFTEGIGGKPGTPSTVGQEAQNLEKTFFALCRSSYEEGLCALYAYEYQIPEIAKAKTEGLAANYDVKDEKTTRFFSVHETADVYHSKACADLMEEIPEEKWERSIAAATRASEALWKFLDESYAA